MGYLGNWRVGPTEPGACPECGARHDPRLPHDHESLAYQYAFYDRHGRWASWADAMAHCDEGMKVLWAASLAEHGIDAGERPRGGTLTIEVKPGEGGGTKGPGA